MSTPFKFHPRLYPLLPGCYLFKDMNGKVIYVGKAKDLRKRLSSYFQNGRKHRRTRQMVERVRDIEVILVNHEIESLILENNLIKQYKPRFNVLLKSEDQGYPYIVKTHEEFPRFAPFKKHRVNWALDGLGDDAVEKRFGPYPSRGFRNTLMEYVNETFMLRECNPMPRRACLLLHMHKCSAPCEHLITAGDYMQAVKHAEKFLSRPTVSAVREMRQRMMEHAERLEFERAHRIKEQLQVLERALSLQMVERDVKHDQDVVCFNEETEHAGVLRIKAGAVLGMNVLPFDGDAVEFLLARYGRECPGELIVNALCDAPKVAAQLSKTAGCKVKISVARAGVAKGLLALCRKNLDYRLSVQKALLTQSRKEAETQRVEL
jgi:excinuclease ABC subunit C